MLFKHHALALLIVGIASFLIAAQATSLPSTTRYQLPGTGIGISSSHIVNRTLKADKLMVAKPPVVEPETTQVPRQDKRGSDIKIGCELPFSKMVSNKSDVAGRCLASRGRLHLSDA